MALKLRVVKGFTLPYGYKVKVRLVSQKQLDYLMGGKGTDAGWDQNLRTIYISKDLTRPLQVEKWFHELEHAVADWRLWARQQMGLEG